MAAGRTRPVSPRRLPTRSCVACRTVRPKRELVRIVRAPDGAIAVDTTGRAPGRGAYLCRDASCWDAAARKRAIEHALGGALPGAVLEILAAGPTVLATSPGGLDADMTDPARTDGPRSSSHPQPTTQGGARGQE